MMKNLNARARAALIITVILRDKINLDEALAQDFQLNTVDQPFIQTLCYGTMRFYHRLDFIAACLLKKKISAKDVDIQALILIGLYQLFYLDTPPYAVISSTVEAAKQLNKMWAANLVNAILRNADRQRAALLEKVEANTVAATSHPAWLLKHIQMAYPNDWPTICEANNHQAPFTIRVNQHKTNRVDYLEKLKAAGHEATLASSNSVGLYLKEAISPQKLPGFIEGEVSVQDESAQLAADLLDLKSTHFVLDACAAPGGKTTHLLEICPELELMAVEISEARSLKIHDNLKRTGAAAEVIVADVETFAKGWTGKYFDRILLDAPCSAMGVIRRHPDIKFLRTEKELARIVKRQEALLTALWKILKPGGILLYVTCSILPVENQGQIQHFLNTHPEAVLNFEKLLLPTIGAGDGFYYAALEAQQTS